VSVNSAIVMTQQIKLAKARETSRHALLIAMADTEAVSSAELAMVKVLSKVTLSG
jgi:hypothetical protein